MNPPSLLVIEDDVLIGGLLAGCSYPLDATLPGSR